MVTAAAAVGITVRPVAAGEGSSVESWSVTATGFVSHQPGGSRDCSRCDPTRDVVSGNPSGLSLGIQRRTPAGVLLAVEASSTASMSGTSEGSGCDFVTQLCTPSSPPTVKHRDTIMSFLVGVRLGRDTGIELKAGPSLVYGATAFDPPNGGSDYSEQRAAVTVGVDGLLPLSRRFAAVPFLRYSHTSRGTDNELGLGRSILRVGVGLRFRL